MTITAAQVRHARKLLRRSSAALSRQAGVGFALVLRAQLDAEIGSVDRGALAALKRALEQSGVEFTAGDVRIKPRKAREARKLSTTATSEPPCPT